MTMTEAALRDKLAPVMTDVARMIGRLGIKPGQAEGAKAVLRVELERNVRRVVQAYWTPFECNIPGLSVGLHLEVPDPSVHWAEGYLSLDVPSWYFAFAERADGDIQLLHYSHFLDYPKALERFADLTAWYVLTATGLGWGDVVYQVSPELEWTEHHRALGGTATSGAIQESLKKSTIMWLRWETPEGQQQMPVWYVMDQNKVYVLSGERQQTIPNAERLRDIDVIVRWKGKNARVAEIPAAVRALEHGPEWDAIAEKLAEKRLNIPGVPEETARRWRDECQILEITLRA